MDVDSDSNVSSTGLLRSVIDSLDLSSVEIDKITELFESHHEELNELFSLHFYQALDAEKDDLMSEHYEVLGAFRERLFETWKTPLIRLNSLLYMCMEIVDELRQEKTNFPPIHTNKFNIATRLQARCVQIGNEISHLLHGGYADGAFARWRTLHETSATTKFICEGDEDLASRFLDFQNISRLKAAKKYNDNNELEFVPIPTEQLVQFENEKTKILNKYEPHFEQEFGWARKALGNTVAPKGNLRFTDLEKFVGLSFLRNHFSFANQYIHAGIDSIGYKLGTSMSKKDILLTGPSNEGLIEPIQCTSLSLIHATAALLKAYPNDDSPIKISVLWLWHEVLKQEVDEADAALQVKGDACSQQNEGC
ncbi:DUF5677 domain-containing protein [Pseudomonas veronii]|jgi:hypothetical protein|uniref:Uncharacterized protein n=2 Tax=Pseudomonas veronii TaxID=76761 RepID=A0ABS0VNS4_PSEVE|nr:DUF5677 domain-containing protein [Pseudomonas veronii]MBI6557290.1 hypothetical protein [Pseudomonas veronii]MBI6653193.1 hypothetical protein [Pseudomonas veronii]SBW82403.1 hypothetical protein PVE_R1G4521 [Pseudomonas veronii 1YdBTEX2]